jgi:lipoprotein-releasing system ATP-binding protein
MNKEYKNAVSLKGVTKIYKAGTEPVTVLMSSDLDIKYGETVAITGESGTGKSTLLHIMGCLLRPDSGNVEYFDDINVYGLTDKKLSKFRNENIGFVFQFHYLLNEFNCIDNVAMPLFIKGEPKVKALKMAKDYLCEFGLKQRLYFKPYMLSGGEQQRTAIARAIVTYPEVILMDEPTGNLDPHQAETLHYLILDLNKKYNKTLIVVTHDAHFSGMMDRKITILNGKITTV